MFIQYDLLKKDKIWFSQWLMPSFNACIFQFRYVSECVFMCMIEHVIQSSLSPQK